MVRRRSVVVRRAGNPLLRTVAVGGAGYMAGQSAARGAAREAAQDAKIEQMQQEQAAMSQQQGVPPQQSGMGGYAPPMPQPQQAVAPAPVSSEDRIAQLSKLGELRKAGVLTDAEFEAEKQKILQGR